MRLISAFVFLLFALQVNAQTPRKQLAATRTTATIKIDGNLDEVAWKNTSPATNFVQLRPDAGKPEDPTCKTEVFILYDNTSIYIGGYCHERTKDSISKELIGRDKVGVNDYVGVVFDTYNDKINAVGFYVTPYGEQFDAKYSENGEDASWNAVWNSESKMHADGWSFEMRIPYSALRFASKENQTWGLNILRQRNKTGKQYSWNPVLPTVNGFVNQEGEWTGISKIESPLRLSFSPYFSTYVNHYKPDAKDWTSSVNGGMDVKYGISKGFTLDMTLVPDFGQVQSDNQVLNLSPYEVKYNENRSFFTEGTELFNKGNLFYSRRIGGIPLHYGDVQDTASSYPHINPNEYFLKNPQEAKLINATKVSGRTSKGLGIGFFNAVTQPMYAVVEDNNGHSRKIETSPLTNYNIIVFDQTLKNNSSVSFINTNVLRNGPDYDADVSAAIFNLNNKKNTYNFNGKFALSQIGNPLGKPSVGYAHTIGFGKTGGRWNYNIQQDIADDKYDINDMGILTTNNYVNHYLFTGYKWIKPTSWYNNIQVNYNATYSVLFKEMPAQKIGSKFQSISTNVNANMQLKNLWSASMFFGYVSQGNDFYEPRVAGYSFHFLPRKQFSASIETNQAKKYTVSFNYFVGLRELFNSPNNQIYFSHGYRFSDKFSVSQNIFYNPVKNDAGFYDINYKRDALGNFIFDINQKKIFDGILFSRRNLTTVENVLEAKYNFNKRSGITFRGRHYWSKVHQMQLYDLNNDGTLSPTKHANVTMEDENFNIFNIDAVYTWQFAPGSFVNIVFKDQDLLFNTDTGFSYFKNFTNTVAQPHNNNLSFKIIYYLDYLYLKKHTSKLVK